MSVQPASERPVTAREPKAGVIILARHGKPAVDRTVRIDWREYEAWWANYDLSGLEDGQCPPEALVRQVAQADIIYASTLPRAIETARSVARGRPVTLDPMFVEAPLPPPLPGRFTPRHWGVFARTAWWLGHAPDCESRGAAEARALRAARRLATEAGHGQTVALFAHGWFNRMMRPVLKNAGWREVHDGGDAYWSFRRFEKDPS